MRENSGHCDRCGGPPSGDRSLVAIESGPLLDLAGPALKLCPECARSLHRWLARERRGRTEHRSAPRRSRRPRGRDETEGRPRQDEEAGLWEEEERLRNVVITSALVIAGLAGVIVAFAFLR